MSDVNQRRKKEAQEHIAKAEKCLKTSITKWAPELDGAASEYAQAATCYRNAKMLTEAKDAYIKTAEIQCKMNSPFHAGKSYEQAGLIAKENKDVEGCVNLLTKAARMFQENGTPDTAALTLERAAKAVEMSHPGKSAELYKSACDVAELEDNPRRCAEFIGKSALLLIRQQRYEEALEALKKEIDFHAQSENYPKINRCTLGVVLVYLHNGDPVEAGKFYQQSMGLGTFGGSEESALVDELLSAYNDGDEEAATSVLARPYIRYMDNAFAKIAKTMVIPGGIGKKKSGGTNGTGAEGGSKSRAQLDDDDDFEEGLT